MRVLPVALLALGDDEAAARLAVEQARITHHHHLSDAGTVLVARLVQLAVLGRSMRQLQQAAAEAVRLEPRFAWSPYRGQASGYVVETIQTVLHFLFSTRSFEECLVAVVNQGATPTPPAPSPGHRRGLLRAGGAAGPLAGAARRRGARRADAAGGEAGGPLAGGRGGVTGPVSRPSP